MNVYKPKLLLVVTDAPYSLKQPFSLLQCVAYMFLGVAQGMS